MLKACSAANQCLLPRITGVYPVGDSVEIIMIDASPQDIATDCSGPRHKNQSNTKTQKLPKGKLAHVLGLVGLPALPRLPTLHCLPTLVIFPRAP